jgi:arylesterase / paraoxonase
MPLIDCKRIEIPLGGPEDVAISRDGTVAYIACQNQRNRFGVRGGIYRYSLTDSGSRPKLVTPDIDDPFHPLGLALLEADGRRLLYVANRQTKHRATVEFFEDLGGQRLSYLRPFSDREGRLHSPNDIAAVSEDQFYVTNSHGHASGLAHTWETVANRPGSYLLYHDASGFRVVAHRLSFANGVALSPDGSTLLVAETRGHRLRVFRRKPDGGLLDLHSIPLGFAPDNLTFDEEGSLWVAGHPSMAKFVAHALHLKKRAPSIIAHIRRPTSVAPPVETVWTDDGHLLSASSTAARYGDRILVGSVFDVLLDCRFVPNGSPEDG